MTITLPRKGQTVDGATFMAEAMTEKQLSDNIVSLARVLGWLVHRDPTWRATGADPGYPDLTLVRDRIIWAELKSAKGKPTTAQTDWMRFIVDAGGLYYEWTPRDWIIGKVEDVLR